MFTDPISDMLTRIRNASLVKKDALTLPFSKFKMNLAKLLEKEGFISGFAEGVSEKNMKVLEIKLKYSASGEPVITGIKRISSPGQRIYLPKDRLPRTNSGFGVTVVSTSRGLMTDRNARKEKIGGEIICQVW